MNRLSAFLIPRNILRISKLYESTAAGGQVTDQIKQMVNAEKVVVFMKGNPEQPRCGFSNAVVQILRMHGVPYNSYDVLEDDSLREGVKEYSQWPTIPQVFIKGEFVGGCDIMLQLHQSGELIEQLEKVGIHSALVDKADETKKS